MSANRAFHTWESAVVWLREQSAQAQLVIDCYYDDPLLDAAKRYWSSEEWQAVRKIISQCQGSALDIGAGRGIASYALARDGFVVTALEPDSSDIVGSGAIRLLAAQAGLSMTAVEEHSEKLPFNDNTFDLVFARAVLHHTKDLSAACREFFRVLKPGGKLVVIREHVISRREDLPTFLAQHPLHKLYGGENAFLLHEYVAAMRQAGFPTVSVISPWDSPINYFPFTLDSLKKEISLRLSKGVRGASGLIKLILDQPWVWTVARRVFATLDHRPGRLYSFVTTKPH